MVLFPGKFIYLALPHTASMVTVQTLVTLDGALGQEVTRVNHHATRAEARRKRPDLFSGDELAVSVVRHPCDLLVTWWLRHLIRMDKPHRKGPRPPSFREFVQLSEEEMRVYSPSYIKGGCMYWMDADEYLRYETLQDELNRLLNRFGLPSVTLPRRNVTQNKEPWKNYYDDDLLGVVEQRFGDEARRFGYEV